jgi:hypothetical protein
MTVMISSADRPACSIPSGLQHLVYLPSLVERQRRMTFSSLLPSDSLGELLSTKLAWSGDWLGRWRRLQLQTALADNTSIHPNATRYLGITDLGPDPSFDLGNAGRSEPPPCPLPASNERFAGRVRRLDRIQRRTSGRCAPCPGLLPLEQLAQRVEIVGGTLGRWWSAVRRRLLQGGKPVEDRPQHVRMRLYETGQSVEKGLQRVLFRLQSCQSVKDWLLQRSESLLEGIQPRPVGRCLQIVGTDSVAAGRLSADC